MWLAILEGKRVREKEGETEGVKRKENEEGRCVRKLMKT